MLQSSEIPNSTAVRVALWRAMHLQVDSAPYVFQDEIGIQLINPDEGWKNRPDMHPEGTSPFRASIVARARFIEDFVIQELNKGLKNYMILGSGLDTFAVRNFSMVDAQLNVYEIEMAPTIEWKKKRLIDLNMPIPKLLHFVPMDFESNDAWTDKVLLAGYNKSERALVTSIGVSMYLTHEAILQTLKQMKSLPTGSQLIMTFMLPLDQVDPRDRQGYERSLAGAQKSGTPFISFFKPNEILNLAAQVGFSQIEHLSTLDLIPKYFAGRSDGLRPSSGEEFLIVTV